MKKSFSLNLPFNLIQSIRLTHALMESDYIVHIPPENNYMFLTLKKIFNLQYQVGIDEVPELNLLKIGHSQPSTQIGSIKRNLIFSRGAFEYCRQLWSSKRNTNISFAGLVTGKRRDTIENWYKNAFPGSPFKLSNKENLGIRFLFS